MDRGKVRIPFSELLVDIAQQLVNQPNGEPSTDHDRVWIDDQADVRHRLRDIGAHAFEPGGDELAPAIVEAKEILRLGDTQAVLAEIVVEK
jgi:hypothetical protein